MAVWMPIYKRNENCLQITYTRSLSVYWLRINLKQPTRQSHMVTIRLSTTDSSQEHSCDAWIEKPTFSIEGSTFTFQFPRERTTQEVYVPLIGRHNIENAIVALTTALMLGYTGSAIADAFRSLPQSDEWNASQVHKAGMHLSIMHTRLMHWSSLCEV